MAIGFIFPAFQVPEGESEYNLSATPKAISLEYRDVLFPEYISFHLVCVRRGGEIFCSGNVKTGIELTCSRCLKRFTFHLNEEIEFTIRLRKGEPVVAKLWEEDVVSVNLHSGAVDLSPRIRDAIILGIPIYPLCHDECKGLCPICGANLNEGNCKHYQH